MPYIHHTSLTLPFRFRSQSDPTPLAPRSFTVDRSSTKHTVFTMTMLQFDGSSESNPAKNPFDDPEPSASPTPLRRSNTVKKRFANIFGGRKKRKETVVEDQPTDEEEAPEQPMQVVSPRATACEPATPRNTRQRAFSFKKRHSGGKNKSASTSQRNSLVALVAMQAIAPVTITAPTGTDIEKTLGKTGGHSPFTDVPFQSPDRREGVGVRMPVSPTRDAALTSHPIAKVEVDVQSEASEEWYETPVSEVASGRSGFFGKK